MRADLSLHTLLAQLKSHLTNSSAAKLARIMYKGSRFLTPLSVGCKGMLLGMGALLATARAKRARPFWYTFQKRRESLKPLVLRALQPPAALIHPPLYRVICESTGLKLNATPQPGGAGEVVALPP